MTHICCQRYHKTLGFGLVELMIALLLAAFLISGILQIFFSAKKSYKLQENMAQMQDSGRNVLYLITEDVRMAGYWGCSQTPPVINNLNNSDFFSDFTKPLQGFNASTETGTLPATWSPLLNDTFLASPYKPLGGSDVLTLRRANAPGVVASNTDKPAPLSLTATNAQLVQAEITQQNIDKGLLALVSNCADSEVFRITSLQGSVITHDITAPTPPASNKTNELKTAYANAKVHVVHTISYFVAENTNQEKLLFRKVDNNAPEELVDGVEEMQVLYGVDTDKDEVPNYYVDASQVTTDDWKKVVSIRVSFLVASLNKSIADKPIPYHFNGPEEKIPNDHKRRRVFTSTIKIRNRFN